MTYSQQIARETALICAKAAANNKTEASAMKIRVVLAVVTIAVTAAGLPAIAKMVGL